MLRKAHGQTPAVIPAPGINPKAPSSLDENPKATNNCLPVYGRDSTKPSFAAPQRDTHRSQSARAGGCAAHEPVDHYAESAQGSRARSTSSCLSGAESYGGTSAGGSDNEWTRRPWGGNKLGELGQFERLIVRDGRHTRMLGGTPISPCGFIFLSQLAQKIDVRKKGWHRKFCNHATFKKLVYAQRRSRFCVMREDPQDLSLIHI